MLGDDRIEKADEVWVKSVLLHIGDTMDPYEVKVPKALDGWVDPAPQHSKGVA